MSEEKVNKAIREEQKKEEEEVSKLIQDILESRSYALQPFMQFSEFGVAPRVRLVKVPKNNDNATGQETNQGEGGESKVEDGAAESKQS